MKAYQTFLFLTVSASCDNFWSPTPNIQPTNGVNCIDYCTVTFDRVNWHFYPFKIPVQMGQRKDQVVEERYQVTEEKH